MSVAIKFENISKQYRLGEVGTGTLSHDLHRAWAKLSGKPDPFAKVGAINDRTQAAITDYVWALRSIEFEVKQGEILGIIGRNGAGKSTLLKLLSRVTAPTTGSIKAKGRIASLLEVGTGFHPELTGRENIYLNGAILGMRRHEIAKQLDEIVEFSGCAKYIDTPVKRYSSGMTVRLGFAVAAHLDCEILVVDEVLAVGDTEFQKKCIGKMREISTGSGRTVLFVSHNLSAVLQLCTKVVVLQKGAVAFNGTPQKGCDEYLAAGVKDRVENHEFRDIDRYRNRIGNAILCSCRLKDTLSNVPWAIPFGNAITLEVVVKVICELQWLELGIAISKAEGTEIVSSLSSDYKDFGPVVPGEYHFSFEFKNLPLLPQVYALGLGLRSERGTEDYVANGPYVEVVPNELSAKLKAETRSGAIIPTLEVALVSKT